MYYIPQVFERRLKFATNRPMHFFSLFVIIYSNVKNEKCMPTSNIKNNFALVEKQQISDIQREKVEEVITYIGSY